MPPKHPHQHHPQQHGGGGGGDSGSGFDFNQVEQFAHQHAGGSGDSSMFSSAMSMISGNSGHLQNQGVDEQSMVQNHQSFFGGGGDTSGATSGGMGQAAAMQALKMFGQGGGSSSSGGGMQQEFMGMAMGQAAKLFDQQSAQGNVASGASKESAIQEAGEQAFKMYMGSGMGGGSSSGLMGLASKFM